MSSNYSERLESSYESNDSSVIQNAIEKESSISHTLSGKSMSQTSYFVAVLMIMVLLFFFICFVAFVCFFISNKSTCNQITNMKEVKLRSCEYIVDRGCITGTTRDISISECQTKRIDHDLEDSFMRNEEISVVYNTETESLVSLIGDLFKEKREKRRKKEKKDDDDDNDDNEVEEDEDEKERKEMTFYFDCIWACKSYQTGEETDGGIISLAYDADTGFHAQLPAYEECLQIAEEDCVAKDLIAVGVVTWEQVPKFPERLTEEHEDDVFIESLEELLNGPDVISEEEAYEKIRKEYERKNRELETELYKDQVQPGE